MMETLKASQVTAVDDPSRGAAEKGGMCSVQINFDLGVA